MRYLGEMIFEPNLWHFNRHSVSYAVLIGIFWCFMPIPFQMLPCAFTVVWVRCNIPLAIGLVWISNPLTMVPMMYFSYRVGAWVSNDQHIVKSFPDSFELLSDQLDLVWQPLLLGCFVTGLSLGIIGFCLVRIYWRWRVTTKWAKRKLRMK